MKKKKFIAWLLAAAMTLGSVQPIFAAETALFTDGGQAMELSEEADMEKLKKELQSQEEDFSADAEEFDETILFSDGTQGEDDGQNITDPDTDGEGNEQIITAPGNYPMNLTSDGTTSSVEYRFSPSQSGYYYVSGNIYDTLNSVYTLEGDNLYIGEPLVFLAESGQTYRMVATTDETELSTININIKKIENPSVLKADTSITITSNEEDVVLLFEPTEDGDYSFYVAEEFLNIVDGDNYTDLVINTGKGYDIYDLTTGDTITFHAGTQYWMVVKNLKPGVSSFEISSYKESAVNEIEMIETDLPEEITGYIELGGANLFQVLRDYNPNVTVTFEDGSSDTCFYTETIENYGWFSPQIEGMDDDGIGNLIPGTYTFCITTTVAADIQTKTYTYSLKSITESDMEIPVIDETESINVTNVYNSYYVYKITAPADKITAYRITYQQPIQTKIYSQTGNLEYDSSNDPLSYYDFTVSGGQIYYVMARAQEDSGGIAIDAKAIQDVWNDQTVTQPGDYAVAVMDGTQAEFYFIPEENGYYYISSASENNHHTVIDEEQQSYGGTPLIFTGEAGHIYRITSSTREETDTLTVNIKRLDSLPILGKDISAMVTPDNDEVVFLCRPEESGNYTFDIPEEVISENTTVFISDGSSTLGSVWTRFDGESLKKDVEYRIALKHLSTNAAPFEITLQRLDSLKELKIISGMEDSIKWGVNLNLPMDIYDLEFQYTLNTGEKGTIHYGEELADYGKLRVTIHENESTSTEIEPCKTPGTYWMEFSFEKVRSVTTERIPYFCVPVSELGLPELMLNEDITVKEESEGQWVTTFTPDRESTYTIQFSQPVSEGSVYTEDSEFSKELTGNSFTGALEAGKTYVFCFRYEEENGQISAKVLDEMAVKNISLDTEKLVLVPGQTGEIVAMVTPASTTEELRWSIEPEDSRFTIAEQNGRKAEIYASDSLDKNDEAIVKVVSEDSSIEASCTVSISNIASDVPKVDASVSEPPSEPVIGIAVGSDESGEKSDAQKTEEDLIEIIVGITNEDTSKVPGVVFEPVGDITDVEESIKNAVKEDSASIFTKVKVEDGENPTEEDKDNIVAAVKDKISQQEAALNVEKKLDITLEIYKMTKGDESETNIGKITELPDDKKITFTVLLTEEQRSKKMYVAYAHDGKVDIIPESDTTQRDGILTFKAQKFSDYYLVSRESDLSVTYKYLIPNGRTDTESVKYGEKLTAPSVQEPANYTFNGWKLEGTNTFWNFAEDRVTTDMTLVGDWTYNRPTPPSVTYYTIRFDSQGGTVVPSQSMTYGSRVKEPTAPVKEGFTFAGWYKEASCTNAWDFAKDTVTSSRTLYAKWTEEPEIPDTPKTPAVSEIISRKGYLEVNLKEAAEGAVGYEYAYGKEDGAWSEADDYTVLGSTTALSYISTDVPAGIYVVKARAYKEVNGEKVYGEWSEGQWTELPTGTLDAPVITGVKVNGRTVTVTLKGTEGAAGYDAVLGETNNPIKPTPYAYLVKNQNTTTLVFKNVADGTYYIGAHAYSKEDGIKYFSKWSNQLQVSVNAGDTPEVEAPGTPTIIGHFAKKGYLKVRIAEGTKDAQGYEYAYSTKDGNWTSEEDYTLFGRTPLLYRASTKIPAGVYAVKVRAFKRVNGERIYGEWSEAEWVELPTGTIKAPKISSVKVKGNTVTVVLTKVDKAVGYDAVLGLTRNPVKPVTYAYVKKNQRSTTIVFRNVKAGTYYIGSHAYTKEDGRKVFSKWSNQKRVTIE